MAGHDEHGLRESAGRFRAGGPGRSRSARACRGSGARSPSKRSTTTWRRPPELFGDGREARDDAVPAAADAALRIVPGRERMAGPAGHELLDGRREVRLSSTADRDRDPPEGRGGVGAAACPRGARPDPARESAEASRTTGRPSLTARGRFATVRVSICPSVSFRSVRPARKSILASSPTSRARFDDPKLDRNVVARETLALLYLGEVPDFERELADPVDPARPQDAARLPRPAQRDARGRVLPGDRPGEVGPGQAAALVLADVRPFARRDVTCGSAPGCARCSPSASSGVAARTCASSTTSSSRSATTSRSATA